MSACSILLVSANRHTSPYPVYPLGLSYLKTYLERTINGIRVDIADCNLLSDAQLAERIRTLAPRYIGLQPDVTGCQRADAFRELCVGKQVAVRNIDAYPVYRALQVGFQIRKSERINGVGRGVPVGRYE